MDSLQYLGCAESCFENGNAAIAEPRDVLGTFEMFREMGYDGVGITPKCLSPKPLTEWTPAELRLLGKQSIDSGLPLGIREHHWLASGFPGVHLTSPDAPLRTAMVSHLTKIAEANTYIAEGMGDDHIVAFNIFGSPLQRTSCSNCSQKQGFDNAVEVLTEASRQFHDRKQQLCMEYLSHKETDFITTAADAEALIEAVNENGGHLFLHVDVKATAKDDPCQVTLERQLATYLPKAAHFHANDCYGQIPGGQNKVFDFSPILDLVKGTGLIVSVEPFEFLGGDVTNPWTLMEAALRYLKKCEGVA